MRSDRLDDVFGALAHADRRRMLDIVHERPGVTVGELAAAFTSSRIAVLKHVRVLEASGLLHSSKVGRQRRLYFNAVPIQQIYDRWTDRYSSFWAGRMADLKDRIEGKLARKVVDRAG
jgi:DNA-binding transcriptional ArsR family regulator